jgi:SAM-dependent methyltransferase
MTAVDAAADVAPLLHWTDAAGAPQQAAWRSERGVAPPKRVIPADDTLPADTAYRLACEGTGLLWQGDFQNARHLLQALARRTDRPAPQRKQRAARQDAPPVYPEAFHRHRMAQAQRARILGALLIPFEPGWRIALRRAPEVAEACTEAWGESRAEVADGRAVTSLRELLGAISAHEWQRQGVVIPALARLAPAGADREAAGRLHPHYGVFSPVRGEYIDLVAQAPWPGGRAPRLVVDVGTGTGVLAVVLARRGAERVLATDLDPRALACAAANFERLGVAGRVELLRADLFPPAEAAAPERADLIVCNPPWLPGRPSSPLERAVYDEGSRMLTGYLDGVAARLAPGGEGWLILSDLAEHLALRPREELLGWIARAGLQVVGRLDARPRHPKAADASDPLHAARSKEVTSLWRLVPVAPVR